MRYHQKDPSRLLRLYSLVGTRYPSETRSMFGDIIESMARPAGNRKTYGELCKVIQKYQSVFSTEETRQVTSELRAKYPRRRTMLELLDNLESSW